MKFKNFKRTLVFTLMLAFCTAFLFGCGSSENSSGSSSADAEDEDSDDDDSTEAETVYMQLDDDSTVALIELESGDGSIYGEYYCESDGSVWTFGGDILGISFTDDDGEMRGYICYLTFYQTAEAEDDGTYQLCLGITNILEGVTSYWYAGNLVDEDENILGVALIDPSDSDSYISLLLFDDDEDDDEEEDDSDTDGE